MWAALTPLLLTIRHITGIELTENSIDIILQIYLAAFTYIGTAYGIKLFTSKEWEKLKKELTKTIKPTPKSMIKFIAALIMFAAVGGSMILIPESHPLIKIGVIITAGTLVIAYTIHIMPIQK